MRLQRSRPGERVLTFFGATSRSPANLDRRRPQSDQYRQPRANQWMPREVARPSIRSLLADARPVVADVLGDKEIGERYRRLHAERSDGGEGPTLLFAPENA
jgi:hypothetical protein